VMVLVLTGAGVWRRAHITRRSMPAATAAASFLSVTAQLYNSVI